MMSGPCGAGFATLPETDTERIGLTSITIPSVEERLAKQWPPLRVAVRSPECLAKEMVGLRADS
jgi:hypothetical protein